MSHQEDNKRCFVSYGKPSKEVGNVDVGPYPDLSTAFGQYGTVVNIDYIETKPIAFVEFSTSEAAAFAIYNLNGAQVKGRLLKVSWEKKKEDKNKKKKKNVDEGEKKEEKKEEKKITEIERPETPIGGLRAESDDKPKKKEKRSEKQETSC